MKSLIALATLTQLTGAAFGGACAPPSITATVLTPDKTSIDQDGGVVVGLITGFGDKADKDLAKLDWKFEEGGVSNTPTITRVAPGLAVFVPTKPVKQLTFQKITVTYAATPRRDMPMAVAPNVTGIKLASYSGPRSSGSSTDATLGAAPPKGTIAVLVYDPAEQKAGKQAKSWASIADLKAKTVQLASSGRCQTLVPGTRTSSLGDKVVLVWLDAEGHQSLPSKEIEIK